MDLYLCSMYTVPDKEEYVLLLVTVRIVGHYQMYEDLYCSHESGVKRSLSL